MSKIKELEKRQDRLTKELEKAKERLEKEKELVSAKEDQIKRTEAELFSALLVENNLTLSDLKNLLSDKQQKTIETHSEEETKEVGGAEHV